jgi:hypothetical protein
MVYQQNCHNPSRHALAPIPARSSATMNAHIAHQRLLRSRLSQLRTGVRIAVIEAVAGMPSQFLKLRVDAETEEKNGPCCAETDDCEYHGVTS